MLGNKYQCTPVEVKKKRAMTAMFHEVVAYHGVNRMLGNKYQCTPVEVMKKRAITAMFHEVVAIPWGEWDVGQQVPMYTRGSEEETRYDGNVSRSSSLPVAWFSGMRVIFLFHEYFA